MFVVEKRLEERLKSWGFREGLISHGKGEGKVLGSPLVNSRRLRKVLLAVEGSHLFTNLFANRLKMEAEQQHWSEHLASSPFLNEKSVKAFGFSRARSRNFGWKAASQVKAIPTKKKRTIFACSCPQNPIEKHFSPVVLKIPSFIARPQMCPGIEGDS